MVLGWDKLKKLLSQAFTWTGIQTFNDRIDITDGTDTHIIKAVNEPGLGGRLTLGLDETARIMVVCDAGDVDTDFGLSVSTNPSLLIYNAAGNNKSLFFSDGIIGSTVLRFKTPANTKFFLLADVPIGNVAEFQSAANMEITCTNDEQSWVYIEPKINQSATAAYNGLKIKVTETATGDASTGDGGGTNNLILAGTSADPDMFKVDNVGRICVAESSDPAALADHAFFYAKNVGGTGEAFAADAAANAAQLTPHNFTLFEPDSLEAYPWSYYAENKALGIKINVDMAGAIRAVEGLTGKTFIYTQNIPKEVDLEKVYKDKWVADYIKAGIQKIEITKAQALETVKVDADKWYEVEKCDSSGICTIVREKKKVGEKTTGYEFIDGEIKSKVEIIWETEKVDKIQVKVGMNFSESDGKFYMTTKPTRAQAIIAAETGFTFNPPKWLGDRLEK